MRNRNNPDSGTIKESRFPPVFIRYFSWHTLINDRDPYRIDCTRESYGVELVLCQDLVQVKMRFSSS